jgi:hypothetical protein
MEREQQVVIRENRVAEYMPRGPVENEEPAAERGHRSAISQPANTSGTTTPVSFTSASATHASAAARKRARRNSSSAATVSSMAGISSWAIMACV